MLKERDSEKERKINRLKKRQERERESKCRMSVVWEEITEMVSERVSR